jgi:hypothetical protein
MATNWQSLTSVKKGNIAEGIVKQHITNMGYIPYCPSAEGAHPFDLLCASRDKQHIFIADSKAKPRRHAYPDTGIDTRHYYDYLKVSQEHNLRVYLYFVDEEWGKIYGNFLDLLVTPKTIIYQGRVKEYPSIETGNNHREIIYFPLINMRILGNLDQDDIGHLKETSTRQMSHQSIYTNGIDWDDIGTVISY